MSFTATFTDTGEERQIGAWCSVCGVTADDWPEVVVSPSGTAHLQADEGMEKTVCGANGAAPGWWWHL